MRDAMGGSVTLIIIVVFIVFTMGYMAFNVNYTKAFRMKDKIISVYEDRNGKCEDSNKCHSEIKKYASTIGYSTNNDITCDANYANYENLYCYQKVELNKSSDISYDDTDNRYYYKIETKINLEIPVINNILDLRFFYIKGDTKTFKDE